VVWAHRHRRGHGQALAPPGRPACLQPRGARVRNDDRAQAGRHDRRAVPALRLRPDRAGVRMTPVCVLRSGGGFGPEHVQWLARHGPGLVGLPYVPVPGVGTIALQHDWPGWWAKMEAYGPTIDGDILLIDLDTVVLRLPETPAETTVLRD